MTSAYSGPETMSFIEEKATTTQTPPIEKTPQKITIPKQSQDIINLFGSVVESPNDPNVIWDFVKKYLTYLEVQHETIKEILDPNSQHNLMKTIKNVSGGGMEWSVYSCFITLSNLGANLAQKENISEKDDFYIKYVMLSFDGDSPIYQFTQLLQTLQSQDEETRKIYDTVNEDFMKAYMKYDSPPKPEITKDTTKSFLDKSYKIAGYNCSTKMILLVLVIIILLLCIGGSAYWYKSSSGVTLYNSSSAASDVSSIYSGG